MTDSTSERLLCDYKFQECEREGIKCYRFHKKTVKTSHDIVELAETCPNKGPSLTCSEYWAAIEERRTSHGKSRPKYVYRSGVVY